MNIKVVQTPVFLILEYKYLNRWLKSVVKTFSFPNTLMYFKGITVYFNL